MPIVNSRVVAITGAARGIGKNIARAFGRSGSRVYVCDIDKKTSEATVGELKKLGCDANLLCIDLSARGAAHHLISEIVRDAGRLDVLINNAQSTVRTSFLEETEDTWDVGLSVTLKAAFFAAQEAVRTMSKSGGGTIVNIASMSGNLVTHESPSYHVAKAGMIQLTRYLAVEAGKLGVRVNCICPAFIVQDEHKERFHSTVNSSYRQIAEYCHPRGEVGSSEAVANAALYLCSDQASFVNGHSMVLDGGATLQDQFCLLRDFSLETASG